ncbi:MAG TPA: FMN-binding protein, partial [Firmicutes bacterium]|nr:FMN-binding protein [Bacillota bacterium]
LVDVTVSGGKVTAIDVVEHSDTGFIAEPTFAELIPQIVESQSLVDVKSGATMTSKGLLGAVSAAVSGKEAQ